MISPIDQYGIDDILYPSEREMDMTNQDNGNNEASLRGIYELHGMFTAHTGVTSKTFKTREGAVKWLSRYSIDANGDRI